MKAEHIRLTDVQQCLVRVAIRRQIAELTSPAFLANESLAAKRDELLALLALFLTNEIEISHPTIETMTFEEFERFCDRCERTECVCGDPDYEHWNQQQLDAAEDREVL